MIKIGFIFPSSDYLFDPFKGDPFAHLQLLTILESRLGGQVDLSLFDLRGIKREFALQHIEECDVYLYSTYTLDIDEQRSIVEGLRARYPRAKHIAGGPHVNVSQKEGLKLFDTIILGEGEESVVEAVIDYGKSSLKRIYRQKSPIDINCYSHSHRKYLPKSAVARKGIMTLKTQKGFDQILGTTVIFSRGCPYQCAFCSMPQLKKDAPGIRYRAPKLIGDEIAYLKREYGVEGINLMDEIGIPLSRNHAIEFLQTMKRTGIVWRGQCRVDGITPELAKLTRESGCVALGMGVESASQRALDLINKKISVERAKESIALLKRNGIETRIYMIIGAPGEPENIVAQTWEFIQETGPDLVILSLFTVRPGTAVHNHPEQFGIKSISDDFSRTMHMYGRYGHEMPSSLSFEYEEHAPWGKGLDKDTIIKNYVDLQSRLRECGLSSLSK